MIYYLHRISGRKVLQDGYNNSSVGDDSNEEDSPFGRILTHKGHLIAVLDTLTAEEPVPFIDGFYHLSVGVATSLIVGHSWQIPVLLKAIFKEGDNVLFYHFVRRGVPSS